LRYAFDTNRGEGRSPVAAPPTVTGELANLVRAGAVRVRDLGVVVFTACSHAGIVNVLHHAREVSDPIPLYCVMGGFHLSGIACQPIIPQTVDDMRHFDLKMIVPGDCTGWRAVQRLVQIFGDGVVVPSAVGRRHLAAAARA
jgi:7,8-dihydropterin-6-yl-methyl-4-(beta-D-ribofuranosyl)aminobenzene 5'-phosphate synthase